MNKRPLKLGDKVRLLKDFHGRLNKTIIVTVVREDSEDNFPYTVQDCLCPEWSMPVYRDEIEFLIRPGEQLLFDFAKE